MNLNELKDKLYDVTASFFSGSGASVRWSEQDGTKPAPPYVMLSTRSLNRNTHPIVGDDGRRYYQCSTIWEINLYTEGEGIGEDEGVTGSYANTALSDMADFLAYLDSEAITENLSEDGIAVMFMPPIRDLSELQNSSQYRFRSMMEMTVSFVMEANGLYGMGSMPIVPNHSGGGSGKLSAVEIEPVEGVEIEEES